jgi:hypothetical protein
VPILCQPTHAFALAIGGAHRWRRIVKKDPGANRQS